MHLPDTGGEDPSQAPTFTAKQLQFSGASLLFIKLDAGLTWFGCHTVCCVSVSYRHAQEAVGKNKHHER